MKSANLAIRFILELAALAALGYSGWTTIEPLPLRLIGATAGPALFAVAWGLFVSPKAPRRMRDPARLIAEIALFALVAVVLAAAGLPGLALVFGVTVGAHLLLMVWWGQRGL